MADAVSGRLPDRRSVSRPNSRSCVAPIVIDGVGFDIHTMLYAAGATILGVQLVLFSLLARTVGVLKNHLAHVPPLARFLRVFTLERGILLGLLLGMAGLGACGLLC